MSKRDWRSGTEEVAGPLVEGEWYRSPLYGKDHLLGRIKEWFDDGIAWCGRPLTAARFWDNEEYGGLWYTNRRSAHCADCTRREKEWHAQQSFAR